MKRVAKPAGAYNIILEEVDVPKIAATEVLVRAERSLISRGSEIWRRYVREEAIDHRSMGYSLVGRIAEVGEQVEDFAVGDQVAVVAPHAEYVAMEVGNPRHRPSVVRLPEAVSADAGTFWPLSTSSVLWMWQTAAGVDDTMVIQGQGLVGSLCIRAAKARGRAGAAAFSRRKKYSRAAVYCRCWACTRRSPCRFIRARLWASGWWAVISTPRCAPRDLRERWNCWLPVRYGLKK